MAFYLKMVNGGDTFYYNFRMASMDKELSQDLMPISLPNQTYREQQYLRFTGQKMTITIDWLIHDNGEDKSDDTVGASSAPAGPFPTGVVTIAEQIEYLEDYMYAEEEDDEFTLVHTDYFADGITVVPPKFNSRYPGDEPSRVFGIFELLVASSMV